MSVPMPPAPGPQPGIVPPAELRRALNFDAVLARARDEAGDHPINEDVFVPVRKLIHHVVAELAFKPEGIPIFLAEIHRNLVTQIRFQRDLARHPEILDEDVSDPLVITGMPRTGTTKLQRMISSDPAVQKLYTWRAFYPAPFADPVPGVADPRIALVKQWESVAADQIEFHAVLADEAEEDLYLLVASLDYFMQVSLTPTHGYLAWLRERPRATAYHFEKRMLQYLQWQDGGRRGRRWVLKSPGHVGALDVLVEVFPGATILNSTRSMAELLGSYCALMERVWERSFLNLTPEFIGDHAIDYWAPEFARSRRIRAAMGDRLAIIDVPYRNVLEDPIGIADAFYRRAELELDAAGRAAMAAWCRDNMQHKHGRSQYSLARYGLTPKRIAEAFPGHE